MILKDVKILSNGVNKLGYKYSENISDIFIPDKPIYGYVGEGRYYPNVDLANISHKCDNFRVDKDNNVICDMTILETPKGTILKGLLESGMQYDTGIAGFGMIEDNVVTEFALTGVNIISKDVK